MPAPIPLSRSYAARDGAPVVGAVDPAVFARRYFASCLACGFCADRCCDHGVDVDAHTVARILTRAERIEPRVGVPRERWFSARRTADPDAAGGWFARTAVVDGTCVFRARGGRGCLLHALAVEAGEDYHLVKPMVSALFPLTFGDGTLWVADEIEDESLVCAGAGPTVYDAARDELRHYFGDALVRELDRLAAGYRE